MNNKPIEIELLNFQALWISRKGTNCPKSIRVGDTFKFEDGCAYKIIEDEKSKTLTIPYFELGSVEKFLKLGGHTSVGTLRPSSNFNDWYFRLRVETLIADFDISAELAGRQIAFEMQHSDLTMLKAAFKAGQESVKPDPLNRREHLLEVNRFITAMLMAVRMTNWKSGRLVWSKAENIEVNIGLDSRLWFFLWRYDNSGQYCIEANDFSTMQDAIKYANNNNMEIVNIGMFRQGKSYE